MHHLLPILFAFTLVNLDDALFRGLKEAMRALEPAADDEALTILAASAARGKNEYVKRTAPSGTPHQITATDGSGNSHDFIFIAEIADGKLGHSIEALDTPGQPISRED